MTSKTVRIYGTGVSADLVRAKDWSKTALGPMEHWPSELVSTVNMVLTSQLMACLIWGPERIQIHNDGFAQLMVGKKNTQGTPFRENWSEVLEEAEPMLSLPITTGKAWYAENIPFNILIDGKLQLRVCNTNLSPIWVQTDEGARIEGLFQTVVDNDALASAEEQLRASEIRANRLLESIGDAVIVTDAEGRIQRMNPIAQSLTGWAEAEAFNLKLSEVFRLVNEETRAEVACPVAKVRETGMVADLANHTILIGKNGQETHIDDSAAPIRNDAGDLIGVVLVFRDIEERRAAEQERAAALARERQIGDRLRFVVQATGQGTWTYEDEPGLFSMDAFMQQLLNTPDASGTSEFWFGMVHPDDRSAHESAWLKMLAGKAPFDRECHMLMDGREFWLRTRAKAISAAGESLVVAGLAEEVTEIRKQRLDREAALITQKVLLNLTDAQRGATESRLILQLASETLGRHLKVDRVGFSESALDTERMHFVTGWVQGSLQPLTGSVPLDHWSEATSKDFLRGDTVVYPDVREEPSLASKLSNYEAVGAVSVLAVPFLKRGVWKGSLYVNHSEPRPWTPQEVQLVEEVAQRTSEAVERAQAEEEVRALAGRLGMAQQAGQMASWQWDIANDLLVWDGGSVWTWGRPPAEMTRSGDIFSYIVEEDRDKVRQALGPAIDGTGEYRSEFRVRWPDGTTHWILAFGKPVWSYDGKPTGIVGINVNVTDQKQAQVALVQTEKLAAVGRLASTMAHEINNPLEAVTNLLYLARTSEGIEEARPYLETADAELRRAATITNQALRFHKQATRPTLSTFGQLTHEIFKGRHSRLLNAGATVEQQDRTSLPVLCFEGEIRQVLNNLVTNAIDALGSKGGKLILRGQDGTDWRTGRAGMLLTLADSGSGMSPNTQTKLFDAFFTTKGVGGTGLGLWVSKEIVERHAGRFLVRSSQREGHQGTVFTIFLPYEAAIRAVVES